ncbi:hypothetical protein A3H19_06030 [Candidatus Woesebacteria bacterium RIFCSPLOWO2_12_FULL_39_9]|nr:MAG: hypothetical protein A3H19_06030 [Candidatus Woesebacteria bacterium RIFCSPLOWO2_12_FULL_39_9]
MKIFEDKNELLLVLFLLAVSGLSHAINMFGFPYYENDEGVYMSQAWSLLREGKVAPYTYWYDHAPVGWIFIAVWVFLTGGFFTFGPSINSGRVFMLILHLATTLFLYFIAKKISGRKEVGTLSVLVYSFSPLGIYYQRRVLLDNIMTFWVFASSAVLVVKNLKLSRVLLSSILFGLAVLTKENAIFFLPFYLYLIYINTSYKNRLFAITGFLLISFSIMSTYILYAVLKKEFFPVGFLGSTKEHVSMLTSFKWQMTRGASLPFWTKGSDFYGNVLEWMNKDKIMVILGGASLILGSLLSIKNKAFRAPVIFGLLFVVFLIRGGLIIGFYIVPLIPIFALLIGEVYEYLIQKISLGNLKIYKGAIILSLVAIPALLLTNHNGKYTRNETNPQLKALVWVKENVPEKAYMVIDNYMYVDLKEKGFVNNKVFPNADWFWKIYYDPEIKEGKYKNDFRKIEYITLSHEMLKQIGEGTQDYLKDVMNNSHEVVTWTQSTTSYLDFKNYISTNGDWMSIFQRNSLESIYLTDSWKNYKKNFIHSYGQTIDPERDVTTSEGQSYAMLRALFMDDKETFDGVWKWTKDHMQHRGDDMLLSWLWGKSGQEETILDSNSASDADEDIALSLIFASKKWDENKYLIEALTILRDIWNKEVVTINDEKVLISSPNSKVDDVYIVNPSYFSPASYKIFAKVDTTHDWNKLADSSYLYLDRIGNKSENTAHLPPNWVSVNTNGEINSAAPHVSGEPDFYGYDAFRVFWRIALDYYWFKDERSFEYLRKANPFFVNEWRNRNKFNSVYTLDGRMVAGFSGQATNSGPLSVFMVTNPDLAKEVFSDEYTKLFEKTDPNKITQSYYDQNWTWFATALYSKRLDNLWAI